MICGEIIVVEIRGFQGEEIIIGIIEIIDAILEVLVETLAVVQTDSNAIGGILIGIIIGIITVITIGIIIEITIEIIIGITIEIIIGIVIAITIEIIIGIIIAITIEIIIDLTRTEAEIRAEIVIGKWIEMSSLPIGEILEIPRTNPQA